MMVSVALLVWAKPMPPIASAVCTLTLIAVYALIVVEGKKAYLLFHPPKTGTLLPLCLCLCLCLCVRRLCADRLRGDRPAAQVKKKTRTGL